MFRDRPFVDGGKIFHGGKILDFEGESLDVTSPALDSRSNERIVIGKMAQMDAHNVSDVLQSAKAAWCSGTGVWPMMTAYERIHALENVVVSLKELREPIVHVLTWEIGKSVDDSLAEFDRTITFMQLTIEGFRKLDGADGKWRNEGGFVAKVRRGPLGMVLNLGPYNYPFNETYAMLIPALLTGNVVIMKVPSIGGLAHMLTMEVYAKHLPPGAINFISGSGKELIGPLMQTGSIDVLAFIGGAQAADAIIKEHPHPHRLKLYLQLESKNLGIVFPDADLDTAVKEITVGATSFNGQRCTTLKLIFVHKSLISEFLPRLTEAVAALRVGMPWEPKVKITPLPDPEKPKHLGELIADAVNKGAQIVNSDRAGGEFVDLIMHPAILYPVTADMRLWSEEQFGPVIPIAEYEDLGEVCDYITHSPFGQQASLFTSDASSCSALVDVLANVVTRVNINTQCSRSPDTFPFSGRRSSALGTMSVEHAIREFSVEVVVAAKEGVQEKILHDLETQCKFLQPVQDAEPPGEKSTEQFAEKDSDHNGQPVLQGVEYKKIGESLLG